MEVMIEGGSERMALLLTKSGHSLHITVRTGSLRSEAEVSQVRVHKKGVMDFV